MLIHTVSVLFQTTMKVDIYNHCSDFKLQYLGRFISGANWNDDKPDEEVDAGSMTRIDLEPIWSTFGGILIYKLERKHAKPGDQSKSTYILLFVTWKSDGYKGFRVLVQLTEFDKLPLYGIDSEVCYQRYVSQLRVYTDPRADTWLTRDGTTLTTRLRLNFVQRDGVLSVTISEGIRDEHTRRPEWVDPER
jgi:hypothetical protein